MFQLQRNGKITGEFSATQIQAMAEAGKITPDFEIRKTGMKHWQPITALRSLRFPETRPTLAYPATPSSGRNSVTQSAPQVLVTETSISRYEMTDKPALRQVAGRNNVALTLDPPTEPATLLDLRWGSRFRPRVLRIATDKLRFVTGLIRKSTLDIAYAEIEHVGLRQSFLQWLLGTGDIIIQQTNENVVQIRGVPHPRSAIELIEQHRRRPFSVRSSNHSAKTTTLTVGHTPTAPGTITLAWSTALMAAALLCLTSSALTLWVSRSSATINAASSAKLPEKSASPSTPTPPPVAAIAPPSVAIKPTAVLPTASTPKHSPSAEHSVSVPAPRSASPLPDALDEDEPILPLLCDEPAVDQPASSQRPLGKSTVSSMVSGLIPRSAPAKPSAQQLPKPKPKESNEEDAPPRQIFRGPRGGLYYINAHGEKVYVPKTPENEAAAVDAEPAPTKPKRAPSKPAEHTPAPLPAPPPHHESGGSGTMIGPRGGRYHYSESGKKVYERRKK